MSCDTYVIWLWSNFKTWRRKENWKWSCGLKREQFSNEMQSFVQAKLDKNRIPVGCVVCAYLVGGGGISWTGQCDCRGRFFYLTGRIGTCCDKYWGAGGVEMLWPGQGGGCWPGVYWVVHSSHPCWPFVPIPRCIRCHRSPLPPGWTWQLPVET